MFVYASGISAQIYDINTIYELCVHYLVKLLYRANDPDVFWENLSENREFDECFSIIYYSMSKINCIECVSYLQSGKNDSCIPAITMNSP